jgi:glucose/mannose transport system permease protein
MSASTRMSSRLAAWLPRLVVAPSLLVVIVAVYLFILWTGLISVTSSKFVPTYDFVGLEQYVRLWATPRWHTAVANLFIFSALFLALSTGLGLLMAILLDQKIRARAFCGRSISIRWRCPSS